MAGSIGISTIQLLDGVDRLSLSDSDLTEQEKVEKAMGLCAFVKAKILFAAAHCLDDINEPEDEILYGTAGYL